MKRIFSRLKTSVFCNFEQMKNVFLIGYMGVGKTTIGKKIAKALGMEFIDLDRFISVSEKESVPEIIRTRGEDAFRSVESNYLKKIVELENVLVSTGGGTPCFYDNMNLINAFGTSIYLEMDVKSLTNRLVNNTESRPLISGLSKVELETFITGHLKSREGFYTQAHIHFNALNFNGKRLEELMQQIRLV